MADPISLASGLLTLVVFAMQSSKTLYQTFDSFQNYGRNIREFKEELAGLSEVLQSLQETVNHTDTKLSSLKLPLLSCGKACAEFADVVARCTSHSKGSRTSIRDWAKLSYKGRDIAAFRSLIAGYKSTIAIALGDANIRTTVVTAQLLNEYKEMIKTTAADLEELLQGMDDKAESELSPVPRNSASDAELVDDEHNIKEERASIEQCLRICEEVSVHIDQVQAKDLADTSTPSGQHYASSNLAGMVLARLTTSRTLESCKRGIGATSSQLKSQLDDLNKRMANLSQYEGLHDDQALSNQSMKEEVASIKQCLNICNQAMDGAAQERVNVFEDVKTADDGHQVIVATLGDLISAKRITVGARSAQWLGQMSDTSLQQLSRDRNQDAVRIRRDAVRTEPDTVGTEPDTVGTEPDAEPGAHFEGRHGSGRKLR